jgi:hypothetical protein
MVSMTIGKRLLANLTVIVSLFACAMADGTRVLASSCQATPGSTSVDFRCLVDTHLVHHCVTYRSIPNLSSEVSPKWSGGQANCGAGDSALRALEPRADLRFEGL